ncbi:MAG: hypothetical protein PHE59_04120, partial [Patescibacteria group bacterium]|nr:hypothetical protein [Patescibacteria group bacterium]
MFDYHVTFPNTPKTMVILEKEFLDKQRKPTTKSSRFFYKKIYELYLNMLFERQIDIICSRPNCHPDFRVFLLNQRRRIIEKALKRVYQKGHIPFLLVAPGLSDLNYDSSLHKVTWEKTPLNGYDGTVYYIFDVAVLKSKKWRSYNIEVDNIQYHKLLKKISEKPHRHVLTLLETGALVMNKEEILQHYNVLVMGTTLGMRTPIIKLENDQVIVEAVNIDLCYSGFLGVPTCHERLEV